MAEINDLNVTDASNTARFPELMAASEVNNSARALEGIMARWHKDTNGSLVSTGAADVFALAANRTISSYTDGLSFTFEVATANTGAATLNVDAVGAQAIVWPDGTALSSGDMPAEAKVTVRYDSGNTRWLLCTVSVPPGGSTKEFIVYVAVQPAVGFPYTAFTGSGTFTLAVLPSADGALFLFHVPNDFSSLTDAVVVTIPDATETVQWDVLTEFGADDELHTANTDSITNATESVTVNKIEELDVSAALTSIAAGDYVGLAFASDTSDIRPFLLRIRYS